MALSFLTPNRTILLVSDDALYVYASGGKGVKLIETVPWDVPDFTENIARIITKDCGKKPVLLLNDMVEQHYRKERVLKSGVSSLDRVAMLKRRLSVAFGKYSVRAALQLKEKIPKAKGQPASDLYIFAAIPDTDQLEKSMGAVKRSLASVAGLCLLPVEAADMVKTLSQKITPKGQKKSVWSILIGQHQSGSLRQIVTKNGEIALTRMSPLAAERSDMGAWAQEVHREFKATMSYLSRFGYDPSEGLDVIIIANDQASEKLQEIVDDDCNLYIMDVLKASKTLGLSLGAQHEPDYADVLHVAWAGKKSKFTLPMKAVSVDKVHRPRQVAMAVTAFLLLGGLFLGYQALSKFTQLSDINSSIQSAQNRKVQLDKQYQREIERKEEMGFDVNLVQGAIRIYDDLEANNIKVLEFVKVVGRALGPDLRIDGIDIKRPSKSAAANAVSRFVGAIQQNQPKTPLFEATMKMTYPGTTNVDRGNQEVQELSERLTKLLPEHKVTVTKFLKDYEYTEGLVVETGDLESENLQQDFVAEIVIEGPPKKEVTQ